MSETLQIQLEILRKLGELELKLDRMAGDSQKQATADWVDSDEFCKIVGIANRKSLAHYMSSGVPSGPDAVRNVGTVAKPRYRFHRVAAANQFLNRSQMLLNKREKAHA